MRALILGALVAFLHLSATAGPADCPPGLAKKDPPCIPPGQAKKYRHGDDGWRERDRWVGRRIDDRYDRLRDPDRYRLDPRGTHLVRNDGWVVRVDPETRKVLNLIGAIDALAN